MLFRSQKYQTQINRGTTAYHVLGMETPGNQGGWDLSKCSSEYGTKQLRYAPVSENHEPRASCYPTGYTRI